MDIKTALLTVLDQVDYTAGNCSVTEMIGAVLPKEIISLARTALRSYDKEYEQLVNTVCTFEAPYDATKWYKPGDAHYEKAVLKFDATQHQPFKYDLEDPINI